MSNAAGMFSGALMTVSLLAVPCVAVFGLPAVGGVAAEAEGKDGVALGGELGSPAAAATGDAPVFAPVVDLGDVASAPATGGTAAAKPHHLDPTSDRQGAVANVAVGLPADERLPVSPTEPAGPPRGAEVPGIKPQTNVFEVPDPVTPTAEPAATTWESAVARLGEFGIRDFHLTNGEVAGEFHFSCSVKDAGKNLTRRFEAEGATPVAAAADVLSQVEACFGTR